MTNIRPVTSKAFYIIVFSKRSGKHSLLKKYIFLKLATIIKEIKRANFMGNGSEIQNALDVYNATKLDGNWAHLNDKAIFGDASNSTSSFFTIISILDKWIAVIFPIIFTFLFIYTFLNAPLKKRRGAGVSAMATWVGLFVLWTSMPLLANVVAGASAYTTPDLMLQQWNNIGNLVPIAAGMATALGIGMALFSAPFQKLRGAGIGVVGFSIVLWFVWMLAPQILTAITGAG